MNEQFKELQQKTKYHLCCNCNHKASLLYFGNYYCDDCYNEIWVGV